MNRRDFLKGLAVVVPMGVVAKVLGIEPRREALSVSIFPVVPGRGGPAPPNFVNFGFLGPTDMTEERANLVRRWRVGLEPYGHTWRMVASAWCRRYGGDFAGNQLAGAEICDRAASLLGESMYDDNWN